MRQYDMQATLRRNLFPNTTSGNLGNGENDKEGAGEFAPLFFSLFFFFFLRLDFPVTHLVLSKKLATYSQRLSCCCLKGKRSMKKDEIG